MRIDKKKRKSSSEHYEDDFEEYDDDFEEYKEEEDSNCPDGIDVSG